MSKTIIKVGEAVLQVVLEVNNIGADLTVQITAGKAHLGAVALATPCQQNPEGVTASVSTLTVPGHRDDIVAREAALKLCKVFNRPTCVIAGLHIDNASREEITALVSNAEGAVNKLIKKYNEERRL